MFFHQLKQGILVGKLEPEGSMLHLVLELPVQVHLVTVTLVAKQLKEIEWLDLKDPFPVIQVLISHFCMYKFLNHKIFSINSVTTILYSAGGASLRTVSSYVGDSSENLESNLGSSGQQGLEINELGRDGLSGNASVEDELKGFGSDASNSGILSVFFLRNPVEFQIFIILFNNILIFLLAQKHESFYFGLEVKSLGKKSFWVITFIKYILVTKFWYSGRSTSVRNGDEQVVIILEIWDWCLTFWSEGIWRQWIDRMGWQCPLGLDPWISGPVPLTLAFS